MALYFSTQNSRIYHEKELMGMDISENVCLSRTKLYIYIYALFNSLNVHRMLQPLTTSSNPIQSLLQLTACQLKKTVLLMTR